MTARTRIPVLKQGTPSPGSSSCNHSKIPHRPQLSGHSSKIPVPVSAPSKKAESTVRPVIVSTPPSTPPSPRPTLSRRTSHHQHCAACLAKAGGNSRPWAITPKPRAGSVPAITTSFSSSERTNRTRRAQSAPATDFAGYIPQVVGDGKDSERVQVEKISQETVRLKATQRKPRPISSPPVTYAAVAARAAERSASADQNKVNQNAYRPKSRLAVPSAAAPSASPVPQRRSRPVSVAAIPVATSSPPSYPHRKTKSVSVMPSTNRPAWRPTGAVPAPRPQLLVGTKPRSLSAPTPPVGIPPEARVSRRQSIRPPVEKPLQADNSVLKQRTTPPRPVSVLAKPTPAPEPVSVPLVLERAPAPASTSPASTISLSAPSPEPLPLTPLLDTQVQVPQIFVPSAEPVLAEPVKLAPAPVEPWTQFSQGPLFVGKVRLRKPKKVAPPKPIVEETEQRGDIEVSQSAQHPVQAPIAEAVTEDIDASPERVEEQPVEMVPSVLTESLVSVSPEPKALSHTRRRLPTLLLIALIRHILAYPRRLLRTAVTTISRKITYLTRPASPKLDDDEDRVGMISAFGYNSSSAVGVILAVVW